MVSYSFRSHVDRVPADFLWLLRKRPLQVFHMFVGSLGVEGRLVIWLWLKTNGTILG